MPDKPAAEIAIDASLVRSLLVSQATHVIPDAANLPLEKVAEGWDSEIWRLGDDVAVRLPRRALAAPLMLHEQRALPEIAQRLAATGVRVPVPVVTGRPDAEFPWAWSVVPWIEGTRGLEVPRDARTGWATALAGAMLALHAPAPADHPVNPVRGRPLNTRDAAFHERLEALLRSGMLDRGTAGNLRAIWRAGTATAVSSQAPVWIHGDLHPGNLVTRRGALEGIIDFGDVTAGDPAYDLAVAWLAFDEAGRQVFIAATDAGYDEDTWRRARAWAAAVVVSLLTHSDDAPDYAELVRDAIPEVTRDAG
ncbi:MAG TPA: aminoglycoside phosphotransferase family protein [Microbacterium sp.]|uniref:aminoglycoside phosphotransferase family protein n=1 Tax=Microbacterium sp. TaxID=51671 RepID=UPI002D040925|nr:aminoglycoside phosphotransferase family protein [Microbacterium sp.]HWI29916.1 aminoglycoside phosphotransferase family protein [Microbacterium sp.]